MAMTTNEILALMAWMQPGQMPLPAEGTAPDALDVGDIQQLLWGFPGVVWDAFTLGPPMVVFPAKRRQFVFPATKRGPFQ